MDYFFSRNLLLLGERFKMLEADFFIQVCDYFSSFGGETLMDYSLVSNVVSVGLKQDKVKSGHPIRIKLYFTDVGSERLVLSITMLLPTTIWSRK